MLKAFMIASMLYASSAYAALPITTQGNQVLFGGQPKSLAGNSFFWSNYGGDAYYNQATVTWLKQDWKSTIVRAAMGGEDYNGYIDNPVDNVAAVKALVDAAIAEDIYVIIDWHSHHAEDYKPQAIEFFTEMAQLYGDSNNVIFEIYNEPLDIPWSAIKDYAEDVIAAIRVYSDNLVVVGTPNWSQDVDIASYNPITDFDNIAYTLHFYAGTHSNLQRSYAQEALNNGIPLFATEWGAVDASGDGAADVTQTNIWMTFLKERTISHLNWSVNDKAEGASILIDNGNGENNQGGWSPSLLTDSGAFVRQIIRGWSPPSNAKANIAPLINLLLDED